MSEALKSLALRAEQDPAFLGHALAEYAHSDDLDDAALAGVLSCSQETLNLLRLCLRPRTEPEYFLVDIAEIATRFNIERALLIEAVRRSNALQAMRRKRGPSGRTLLAARDREPGQSAPPTSPERHR